MWTSVPTGLYKPGSLNNLGGITETLPSEVSQQALALNKSEAKKSSKEKKLIGPQGWESCVRENNEWVLFSSRRVLAGFDYDNFKRPQTMNFSYNLLSS